LNHRKKIKAESSRLIPRKLTENQHILLVTEDFDDKGGRG